MMFCSREGGGSTRHSHLPTKRRDETFLVQFLESVVTAKERDINNIQSNLA
jgi:hypothetical protein